MIKIKNNADEARAITGAPLFHAGEIKEVDEREAEILLKSQDFSIVKEKESKKKSFKAKDDDSKAFAAIDDLD